MDRRSRIPIPGATSARLNSVCFVPVCHPTLQFSCCRYDYNFIFFEVLTTTILKIKVDLSNDVVIQMCQDNQ